MLGWEFPPLFWGGLGVHSFELTKSLAEKGVNIDFFMPKTKIPIQEKWLKIIQIPYSVYLSSKKPEGLYPYLNIKRQIRFLRLDREENPNSYLDKYNLLCHKMILKEHRENPYDVIHSQSFYGFKGAFLAKKRTGLPLVLTLHTSEYGKKIKDRKKGVLRLERSCVKHSDKIIAVSDWLKQLLIKKHRIRPKKVTVIYNGIDIDFFKKRFRKLDKEKCVLFLGRIEKVKGIDFFLESAKKILEKRKNIKFIVVGHGKRLKYAVKLTKKFGIVKNIIFTGLLPHQSIPEIYASSDVYVCPSIFDAFSITVLEAMASGIPVVVSKMVGTSKLIEHCMKVDYWNTNQIANAVLNLLENEKLREKLVRGAKQEIKKFSWENAAKETIQVYQDLNKF